MKMIYATGNRERERSGRTPGKAGGLLDRIFKLEQNRTTVKTELVAGLTTFMAMVYIVMVNAGMFADPFGTCLLHPGRQSFRCCQCPHAMTDLPVKYQINTSDWYYYYHDQVQDNHPSQVWFLRYWD